MQACFARTASRGPDMGRFVELPCGYLGFQRLAIMGLDERGMQPFCLGGDYVVCNGELYGFRPLRERLEEKYTFVSESDCEILLPLYHEYGLEMFRALDAEFALVIYDAEKDSLVAARDPIGIRPLYYGALEGGGMAFASEPKDLMGLCEAILPFPPGCYWADGQFVRYAGRRACRSVRHGGRGRGLRPACTICSSRASKSASTPTRPSAFCSRGGLDSSLVCAIAQRELERPIRTFAIGMDVDAIDLKYARQVAEYIGSDHTEVIITKEDVLQALPTVVELLATYDITTIRASMGMYLVCKYIHEHTDMRVLLTGEVSDELFGYKYTDFAPNAAAFQHEAEKRVRELHMYDVLRADRCISVNSLEARVPFGDLAFVRCAMAIDPALKMNRHGMGKYLLRKAFAADGLLPENILWRQKAAFSDAVGHSLVDDLKALAEATYTDAEAAEKCARYAHARPFHEGEPALPRAVRALLPRPEPHGGGLLDAQPRLARLRRGRPLRARAGKLRGKRGVREEIERRSKSRRTTVILPSPMTTDAFFLHLTCLAITTRRI